MIFDKLLEYNVNISVYGPLNASCYVPTPNMISNAAKGISPKINPNNEKGNKCHMIQLLLQERFPKRNASKGSPNTENI